MSIYVISDLHGYPIDNFKSLLSKAEFSYDDYLFVLGDVIDRGADGIKYLKWLMLQSNVELVLGNHEAMMLSCDFLFDDISEESISRLSVKKLKLLETWLANGASRTLEELSIIRPTERKYILEYLREAPLYEELDIDGKNFILTHSGLGNYSADKELSDYTADELLWNRPKITDKYNDETITVFGHTPTYFYGEEYNGKILKTDTWINIDAGCGHGNSPVLLRLDDMKEFFV
ncbi:MAG: metallophosphoesterase [Acutalibacteraceae bacterium]|nr:metallophosphoesterase [Acutalibacteraceae bacterium]